MEYGEYIELDESRAASSQRDLITTVRGGASPATSLNDDGRDRIMGGANSSGVIVRTVRIEQNDGI